MTALTGNYSGTNGSDVCPVCDGTGWELFWRDDREIYGGDKPVMIQWAKRCTVCRGVALAAEQRQKRATLPQAFYDTDMSFFKWDIYMDDQGRPIDMSGRRELVESFIKNYDAWSADGFGLYIWSAMSGSGKTFLASAITNTLIKKKRIKAKFVPVSELINLEKTTEYGDPIKELCEVDLLVLDDLGATQSNSWLNDILFRIFDQRDQKQKSTIVTSNVKIANLYFDKRIIGRLDANMQNIPLPDYCVRTHNAKERRRDMLRSLGLMGKKEDQQMTLNI